MNYYSTNGKAAKVSFRKGTIKGLAEDKGLYFPESIPKLSDAFFQRLPQLSLAEIAWQVMRPYVLGDISDEVLKKIVQSVFQFDIPLVAVREKAYALELFHGPTLAFKDVGARFMSRCMSYFSSSDQKVTVLVATSGDTGSAVANGFLGVKGVDVIVLYPKGKVSEIQEKQFATLGKNITALAVDGNFDNCQSLVKEAFMDKELNSKMNLSSANSINLARWLPQSIYYFYAFSRLKNPKGRIIFSVPSGNYGNITAGILAKKMGLPIHKFIAASNQNDVVPRYLKTGLYKPYASVPTIANAMDVGAPSNFVRLQALYGGSLEEMRKDVLGYAYEDVNIKIAIKHTYQKHGYLLDPHGAVGYLALTDYQFEDHESTGVFLETAHPAKFLKQVQGAIKEPVSIPRRLQDFMQRKVDAKPMNNDFVSFKNYLLKRAES